MNFLAHLLLAEADDEARVGQVLADFVNASSIGTFAQGIQAGIRAHQRIDAFADGHAAFSTARRRFRPPYRRYAGVLLDVYFDHFLANAWDRYGDGSSLPDFAESSYRVLHAYRHLPAERFRRAVDAMRRDNWLVGYADLEGVDLALKGIARRCRRENPLGSGARILEANYESLRSDFEVFFPQLQAYVAAMHAESSLDNPNGKSAGAPEHSKALPVPMP